MAVVTWGVAGAVAIGSVFAFVAVKMDPRNKPPEPQISCADIAKASFSDGSVEKTAVNSFINDCVRQRHPTATIIAHRP